MLPYHVMQSDKKEILPETEEKLSFRNIKKKAPHNLVTSNHEQTFFIFSEPRPSVAIMYRLQLPNAIKRTNERLVL